MYFLFFKQESNNSFDFRNGSVPPHSILANCACSSAHSERLRILPLLSSQVCCNAFSNFLLASSGVAGDSAWAEIEKIEMSKSEPRIKVQSPNLIFFERFSCMTIIGAIHRSMNDVKLRMVPESLAECLTRPPSQPLCVHWIFPCARLQLRQPAPGSCLIAAIATIGREQMSTAVGLTKDSQLLLIRKKSRHRPKQKWGSEG